MNALDIFILALSLAMDAFAVSMCKGLALRKCKVNCMLLVGAWFGLFQGIMPLGGYFLAGLFKSFIEHWTGPIAFVLLCLIGGNMIREALSDDEEEANDDLSPRAMFPLAIATSIDAMASGVTLATGEVNIFISVLIIGLVTFLLSTLGVKIGNLFGTKYKQKAELVGGCVLCLLGIKILLTHFGILS